MLKSLTNEFQIRTYTEVKLSSINRPGQAGSLCLGRGGPVMLLPGHRSWAAQHTHRAVYWGVGGEWSKQNGAQPQEA